MSTRAASPASEVAELFARLAPLRERLARSDGRLLDLQVELSEVAAPTGLEARRAQWVGERLGLAGCAVGHDAVGNLIGRLAPPGCEGGAVVVCAHLDTVFPADADLRVARVGERLVGPGITDNSRGVAAMISVAGEIAAACTRGEIALTRPIEFVGTVGEEGAGDLRGAKHYFAGRGRGAAAAIALDGAGDERIVHRAVGSRRYRIAFEGPGGHSWAAFGAVNAVHAAASAAAQLAALELAREPRTTLTVGRIGGGISVNSIPAEAWLEVDVRSFMDPELARLEAEVERAARTACAQENERRAAGTVALRFGVERFGDRPGGETPADSRIVSLASELTRLVGRTPQLSAASTDANVPIALGIPAVSIGAGGLGGDAHTLGEWYENVEGQRGIARALGLIVGLASS